MPLKPNSVVPALKDKVINYNMPLSIAAPVLLFMDPVYDYDLKAVSALISVVSQGAAAPFTLGFGTYTDHNGNVITTDTDFLLPAANCLDANGQPFSTAILVLGSLHTITLQSDPHGLGLNILPAGAPLVVTGAGASNTGYAYLSIKLRPKQKDRGDSSKRPWGASDAAFATYLR